MEKIGSFWVQMSWEKYTRNWGKWKELRQEKNGFMQGTHQNGMHQPRLDYISHSVYHNQATPWTVGRSRNSSSVLGRPRPKGTESYFPFPCSTLWIINFNFLPCIHSIIWKWWPANLQPVEMGLVCGFPSTFHTKIVSLTSASTASDHLTSQ